MQSPSFYEVLYSLAVKDIVVIVLRLGVFEGKCFNEERIAKFLGLDLEEVIEIIKKFLWLYQYQNKGCQCASEEAFNYDIAVKVLRKQK